MAHTSTLREFLLVVIHLFSCSTISISYSYPPFFTTGIRPEQISCIEPFLRTRWCAQKPSLFHANGALTQSRAAYAYSNVFAKGFTGLLFTVIYYKLSPNVSKAACSECEYKIVVIIILVRYSIKDLYILTH